jgi:glycosyltransferase involved in cell wall biosynthesis
MSADLSPDGPSARPLRILHVSEVHWGGVVTLMRHFTREQVTAGHAVHVLAPTALARDVEGVRHPWSIRRSRPWTLVPALRQLRTVVARERPDVIHVHSFVAGLLARLPLVGAVGGSAAIVYQPHAWSFELFGSRLFNAAVKRWERWASRRTDMLVTNCRDEILEGKHVGVVGAARVLGVAVDTDRFHPVSVAERTALREQLGLASRWVVLCLGRLVRQKGQDLLVPAWEVAHPEGSELVLVGPGDPTPLRELAPTEWSRSISWRGEQQDVERWLAAADVLVVPSRYETVALVVAEAMACGIPVVTTRFNGAEETVTDGPLPAGGAVVDLGDMRALIDQVRSRLHEAGPARAESAAARTRAQTLCQPRTVAERLEAAYVEAIAVASVRQQKEYA